MTPELLRATGEALFGPLWQSDLARALGVDRKTIQRWLKGTYAMPDELRFRIARIADGTINELRTLRRQLEE